MPIDIAQFLPLFIEECTEILQETEQTLLSLDINTIDEEGINTVFRCMHTIKGTSSVFNFTSINVLSHTLENYLDYIRSGKVKLTQNDIDLLLKGVDVLRGVLANIQNKNTVDDEPANNLINIFKNKIQQADAGVIDDAQKTNQVTKESSSGKYKQTNAGGWKIKFQPNQNILQIGNEPTRIFNALADFGKLEVYVDYHHLPKFPDFNPTECYLEWEIKVHTDAPEKDIQDVFFWVAENENVSITKMNEVDVKDKAEVSKAVNGNAIAAKATSIRVTTDKLDNLINIIGEFVITQSSLNQIAKNFNPSRIDELLEKFSILEHNSRELQASVMRIRMVPIESVFNRFPRMVHDLAKKMGKQVELVITGEQTELDKNMMEKISDPLLHLVRNALDHGIETPEERIKKGKSPTGIIQLSARQEGSNIVIEVTDDGEGLNKDKILSKAYANGLIDEKNQTLNDDEVYSLIFQPRLSTADTITDVSGRGVCLDVVFKNVSDLDGEVDIDSTKNEGTCFSLSMPLTLAIMDCQLVRVGEQIYIIPLMTITEIIGLESSSTQLIDDETELYYFRGSYIPIIKLNEIFSVPNSSSELSSKFLLVADVGDQLVGLLVDELMSQQQVVIKSLEDNYGKINGIAGVTILGDGSVALIVDVKAVIDIALKPDRSLEKARLYLKNQNNDEQATPIDIAARVVDPEKKMQVLSFYMGGQEYGIDILSVKEIRMAEKATLLPDTPHSLKGVINVRGVIIPVMDLRERFSLGDATYTPHTAIIIVMDHTKKKSRSMGIIVDQVSDTYNIANKEIQPLPESHRSLLKDHITGLFTIDDKMITLINLNNLLSLETEQEQVS